MSLREEECKTMKKSTEENGSQPLVSAVESSPLLPSAPLQSILAIQHFFKWKGIALILLWNIIVGVIHGWLQCAAIILALLDSSQERNKSFQQSVYLSLGFLGFLSVCQMILYPLGGLLADLKYGRYKIVTLSQIQIVFSFLIFSSCALVHYCSKSVVAAVTVAIASSFLMLIGFSGFQSNAVQFGLDQLLEAPSKHLSTFLCWYVWTFNLGELFSHIIGSACLCSSHIANAVYYVLPVTFTVLSGALLIYGCCKHNWFYCEMKTHNPYRLIYQVLKFTAKNKYPLRRSAFTYCDDIIPSRIDFAKNIYGGPFTTEVVEDVKTFLRMILMLFLIASIFYYTVPGINAFPLYALHMGRNEPANKNPGCYSHWVLLQSGTLSYIVTFFAIPFYVLIFQPCVRKWFVRILQRLMVGIIVVVMFMWVLNIFYGVALKNAAKHSTNISCLFTSEYRNTDKLSPTPTLQFPNTMLILPNVISGFGWPIINLAVLEFISAQSPHTMKGLLLGIFYLFRGLFSLLGCVMVFPFAYFEYNLTSPFLECGFLYYTVNSLLGVVFIAAAMATYKWYKYRQREDKPYDHRYVEDYYRKYATRSQDEDSVIEEDIQSRRSSGYHTITRT